MLGFDPNHAFILLSAAAFCWYALIVWVFLVDHTTGTPRYKNPPKPPTKKTGIVNRNAPQRYECYCRGLFDGNTTDQRPRVTTDETSFEKRGGIC